MHDAPGMTKDDGNTPAKTSTFMHVDGEPPCLRQRLFCLCMFIAQEGLLDDARQFLEEYGDWPLPFS